MELASFLGAHSPFQSMDLDEREALAAASTFEDFASGEIVTDYSSQVPDDIWMVCTGHVTLQSSIDGSTIDTVEPGGIFGYMPMLTGGGMGFVARAAENSTLIRLPGGLVRTQFAKPSGLAFLASSAWNIAHDNRIPLVPVSEGRPVGELVGGEVLVVDPDTSVRDAVVAMTQRHVSYALIRLADGQFGIFTDRDLRTRVVAAGLAVDVPIAMVMSAPARRVTADLTAETVLMEMLESGLRHMPVISLRGEVLGVLEDADLLAASARQSFVLRRSIGLAADADELQRIGGTVTGIAAGLFGSGTKAAATSSILSIVLDSLVRKALELAIAEASSGENPPPTTGFAWLTLGSIARREAMPSSDVDSALSWADDMSWAGEELRSVAARTHEILGGCGLPADSNGALASKPLFSRSASEWTAAADRWLDDPLKNRGLILSSLLLDGRVIRGDEALHTVPAAYRRMRVEHPNALRLQLLDALSSRVRARSLRDVLARRGGTFDLKSHALTPIVNLARWGGLTADLASASTPARLSAAAATGALSERDAATLGEVFTLLQRLRMAHQVDQLGAGQRPGDVVTMSELSPLNRSLLNDALREIAAIQRRVGHFGTPTG